jgi:hypothetical protein
MARVHEMPLPKAALAAFVAMMVSDLIGTAMVVYEAHYLWLEAGLCDVFGYLAGLVCSVLAIDSILQLGFRNRRSLVLIAAVTMANFAGTALGVLIVRALSEH